MSKVEIKKKLDYLIYTTYNKISEIHFNFSRTKKIVSVNKKFSNIHENQRCFIIGTGPSLKRIDAELLKNEIIFGVNFLYKGNFLNNITPKYYFLYDQIFHTTHIDDTKLIVELFPDTTIFLRTKAHHNINKYMVNKNNNIFYQHCNLFQYDDYIKCDLEKSITAPFNVLLGCIQTAIYMGFTNIYLLGSDFNSFATVKVQHFYDDQNNSMERKRSLGNELSEYAMVAYHHYALQKYARSKGIKIINLTEDSLLDAYPKDKFENVINK